MKKITLLFLVILSSQFLLAQVVLTAAYNFELGDTFKYNGYEGVTNIEPGPAGANQTWNFETLVGYGFYEGVGDICVPVSGSPFADSAGASNANIVTKNIGDEDSGPFQYYNQNNNVQELLAMGFVGDGNSTYSNYSDILTAVEYPFAYGDDFEDSWISRTFNIAWGFHFMADTATASTEADAWGTITTPLGTYQNALRMKRTTTYTLWFRWIEGGDWSESGPYTDIDYLWYVPGIKVPVMIISEMEDFEDYGVRYLDDYNFPVAIEEDNETTFELFPNPATDRLIVKSEKFISQASIYSISGQQVQTAKEDHMIDVSSLPNGLYLINIKFEDGSQRSETFIKN